MTILNQGVPPLPTFVKISDYFVDAFLSEDHTYETDVSEYPIESGSAAVDHIRLKPITVSVELLVSDSPIGTSFQLRKHTFTATDNGFANKILPSGEALDFLLALREAREPITIITSIKTYPNMVMTSLSVPRDGDTGHALKATARFQQIIVIKNKRTLVQLTTEPRGKGKKSLGSKASKTVKGRVWLCPEGVTTSVLDQINVQNKCEQVYMTRTGKVTKYTHANGRPVTAAELQRLNDNVFAKVRYEYIKGAEYNTTWARQGIPISRYANNAAVFSLPPQTPL